jgi:hypothetical protein
VPTPSRHLFCALVIASVIPEFVFAQQSGSTDQTPSKHILWVIPNYRTSPTLIDYEPLTAKEKFVIASQDTFDRGTVALAGAFAGESQLSNSDRSFGQGVEGFVHRWATSYADFAVGNFMTEGIFPTLLHQDPRYFRRGDGSIVSRLGYAVRQVVWTRTDSGGSQFNFSEIGGNSAAVAISMGWHPDDRRAGDALSMVVTQIAVDAAVNVAKEFWVGRPRSKKSKTIGD